MVFKMLEKIELEKIVDIALKAGKAVMEIYKRDFKIEYKDDKSPLTEADTRANNIICTALLKLYPEIPILSEENKKEDYSVRKNWEYYWCIDPIDGTKEFIKKNGEFTINIALVFVNKPVLGVVYLPASGDMYKAKSTCGAYKNKEKLPIIVNNQKDKSITIVTSRSHPSEETQQFIKLLEENAKEVIQIKKGSSLKMIMVAEGTADVYPRFAPTMEWDSAAADAIVRESGKMMYDIKTSLPLVYNKEDLHNPWFVVQ